MQNNARLAAGVVVGRDIAEGSFVGVVRDI